MKSREDGNPARANIKQALGLHKDGDADASFHFRNSDKYYHDPEECELRFAYLKTSLRFASRPHCVLLQDLIAFCFKLSLRFASTSLRFAQDLIAFCFKLSLRFASTSLRFAQDLHCLEYEHVVYESDFTGNEGWNNHRQSKINSLAIKDEFGFVIHLKFGCINLQFCEDRLVIRTSSSSGVKHLIPRRLTRYLNPIFDKALGNRSQTECWTGFARDGYGYLESQYIGTLLEILVDTRKLEVHRKHALWSLFLNPYNAFLETVDLVGKNGSNTIHLVSGCIRLLSFKRTVKEMFVLTSLVYWMNDLFACIRNEISDSFSKPSNRVALSTTSHTLIVKQVSSSCFASIPTESAMASLMFFGSVRLTKGVIDRMYACDEST
ncbi:hypothetical protein Tco_0553172 [Tanacetum coccineum]